MSAKTAKTYCTAIVLASIGILAIVGQGQSVLIPDEEKELRWFGNGKYISHCDGDYDKETGECETPFKCKPPWIGPICQHIDAAKQWHIPHARMPSELFDDGSCVSTDVVQVSLNYTIYFTWIRIDLRKKAEAPFRAQIELSHRSKVVKNVPYNVLAIDEKSYLLRAVRAQLFYYVTMTSFPGDVCAFEINGGCNVLLNTNVTMSPKASSEEHSINGVRDKKYCPHGKLQDYKWWKSVLPNPALISMFVIYTHRGGQFELCHMKHFQLSIFKDGKEIGSYQDTHLNLKLEEPVYISTELVNGAGATPTTKNDVDLVTSVKFSSRKQQDLCHEPASVVICELSAYGETVCPKGMIGFECDKPCDACEDNLCDMTLGCLKGCRNSANFGRYCDMKCKVGTWGPSCTNPCTGCVGACNIMTGICDECLKEGTWGPACDMKCETTRCKKCDIDTGENCTECEEGFNLNGDSCVSSKEADKSFFSKPEAVAAVVATGVVASVGMACCVQAGYLNYCGKICAGVLAQEVFSCGKRRALGLEDEKKAVKREPKKRRVETVQVQDEKTDDLPEENVAELESVGIDK